MYNGIDVSKWQGEINWPKVKAAGIDFAMIRSSLGSYTKDPFFDVNITGAQDAGIDVGIYHYFYSKTAEEALAEAKFFLEVIKPYKPSYPVVLDVEENDIAAAGRDAITDAAVAFCDAVERAGYYVMIYANRHWIDNYLSYERIKRFDIWLAHWSDSPSWENPFGIWQRSNSGAVDGIGGNVDLDVSYKDYPAVIAWSGLNGLSQAQQVSAPPSSQETVYTVIRGDSLSSIAARYGTTFQILAAYNGISDPNLIHPGQRIKIPVNSSSRPSAPKTYVVAAGDTLTAIAQKFGTTYQKLAAINNIQNPNLIRPGQIIKLP